MSGRLAFWVACAAVAMAAACSDAGPAPDEQADEPELRDPSGLFSGAELGKIAQLSPEDIPRPADPTNAFAHDEGAAKLGQALFFDTRLSSDGEQSCATCHQPDHGFSDPKKVSEAVGTTARHAPSLLNVAYNRWYFWDGRADSLWAQAIEPLEAPHEQGTTRLDIAHLVAGDAELREAYESIFEPLPDLSDTSRFPESGRPVPNDDEHAHAQAWESMDDDDQQTVNRILSNATKSIAAYQMQLVSVDAPFDRYVDGLRTGDQDNLDALTDSQKRGLQLFIGEAGCLDCHSEAMFTNLEFHNLGLAPRAWLTAEDLGRWAGIEDVKNDPFNAGGRYSDAPSSRKADELEFLARRPENEGQFKTPTLRNVELTAPYMHGGHFETLEEVVRFYSALDESPVLVGHRDETLEPLDLDDQQVADLVAFLKALTGRPVDPSLTEAPTSALRE
ncbi:MAG: cytochrome-c peroxidase [Persicimonas sp.]